MILNSDQRHPNITDYTLGLLNTAERKAVEMHAADCPACRAELGADQQLTNLLRTTLQTATHVDNGRLQKLMPALPTRRPTRIWQQTLQRQLVPVCMLLLLFFGGLGVYQTMQHEPTGGVGFPTALAVTATNTATPTETAVATKLANDKAKSTAVAIDAPITPSPVATPIAFLTTNSQQSTVND